MRQTKWLAVDTILMLILGAGSVASVTDALGSLLILLTGGYLLLDLAWGRTSPVARTRRLYLAKVSIVMLAVSIAVVLPAISMIFLRQSTSPERHIHDGALQTELSIEYLLQGKNPYAEDFRNTPLAAWHWDSATQGTEENPALDHNAYLPFTFVLPIPLYVLFTKVLGWYDQRIVGLLLFLCAFWPLARHAQQQERKLSLLILFGLNLFFAPFTAWGGNDSVVLFFLVMSTYLLIEDRMTLSALSLGLACASKQTAWLFVPFFLTYVWVKAPTGGKISAFRKTYPLFLIPLLLILPFILWNPSAFLDDTLFYMSGQSASSYPIRGVGIGALLFTIGVVSDKSAYFPFALLQGASCLPLLIFLLRRQTSLNSIRQCWLGYGLLLLTFSCFSRFFNHSLLGMVVIAIGIGLLAEDQHGEAPT
ncbi:MAG TPA: hypothetical protein VMW58_14120 [Anaerolineae bacterium]|nr:hypothetical protein [Anaerolineae bacterium]